ncbi:MAG: PBSX family phage terminase large subunit [Cyclobacteriaceae bacterium]
MISENNINLSNCISPNFHQLHKDIKDELYDEIWLRGGRGSTKSSFVSIEIILGIMKDSNANAVVFRRYENLLRGSVLEQLEWATIILGVDHLWKFGKSPMVAEYLPTGQKIIFKGADNPKNIKGVKLSRGYIKYIWFEEVDQFGGMGDLRNLTQSIFRGTDEKQLSFYTYNPPKSARSWANAETKISKHGRKVHFSDYREVPKKWLGQRFIAEAEHLKKTNENAYRHEYLGEEIGTGLEIFNNVTIRTITDNEISYFDNYYQGLDFGYAVDPLSFEQFHYDSRKRILYIFFEISGVGISNRVLAEKMTVEQKGERTTADSAEPKSIAELKDDYGLDILGAEKGPGSIEFGIKWLQDLEEIVIDPVRCPLASNEFVNYSLELNKNEEVINRYPDKDNHAIDSVRYGCERLSREAKLQKKKKQVNINMIPTQNRW